MPPSANDFAFTAAVFVALIHPSHFSEILGAPLISGHQMAKLVCFEYHNGFEWGNGVEGGNGVEWSNASLVSPFQFSQPLPVQSAPASSVSTFQFSQPLQV